MNNWAHMKNCHGGVQGNLKWMLMYMGQIVSLHVTQFLVFV